MPLLSTRGGGSIFGFGYGGGAKEPYDGYFNLKLVNLPDLTANNRGFHTPYSNINAHTNVSNSNGTAYPGFGGGAAPVGMTMPKPGFFNFILPAGSYNVTIQGGSGSGENHGNYRRFSTNITAFNQVDVLCMPGIHGGGAYSGGGMSGIFLGNDYSNINGTNTVLVVGGGGGGYSSHVSNYAKVPDMDTNAADNAGYNQTRLGTSGGVYDGGAAVLANYTVETSSNANTIAAQHVVQGALGGRGVDCGGGPNANNGDSGGFGGGGGECPGGGGGWVGGYPGGNSPNFHAGGAGRNYYKTSGNLAVSAAHIATNANSNLTNNSQTNYDSGESGYIQIVGPN